jgi:P-type Cu2+ transporter
MSSQKQCYAPGSGTVLTQINYHPPRATYILPLAPMHLSSTQAADFPMSALSFDVSSSADAVAGEVDVRCYHCGEPNPPGAGWRLALDGAERAFCCAGCRAVAQTIRAAGLESFYTRRTGVTEQPVGDDGWQRHALAAEAAGQVVHVDAILREIALLLEGIRCGACVWVIEKYLQQQPGVVEVSVNFATRRARIRWDDRTAKLPDLLGAIAGIGYRAYPYDPARREALARRQNRALLARMAIAVLAMMQVMMFAVPAYISRDGVEREYQILFDWASLVLTVPVVFYAATPFFSGAWRDLQSRRLGMDVPVALGIVAAFAASAWATVTGRGAVYFDSVTMFVGLLLVARWFELRARQKAADDIEAIARELPQTAERLNGYPRTHDAETVVAAKLLVGDIVRVDAAAPVPADGDVLEGRSSVEEALLTGESWPRARTVGDKVLAGSINRESPLIVRVTAAGGSTTLAALCRLVDRAASQKPRIARIADRVAGWFVGALLLVAGGTAVIWWRVDASRALMVTFAVLVVSCPCALSLATPAALAAAAGALGRRQILAVRADAMETLSRVTHVVLDKTGTLTTGLVRLVDVTAFGQRNSAQCLSLAAALEQGSVHPVAVALRGMSTTTHVATNVVAVTGCGVEGTIGGRRYRCGRPDWVGQMHARPMPCAAEKIEAHYSVVALADKHGWLAWMTLGDTLRPSARALVDSLHKLGIKASLVSGDRAATVQHVAQAVGIEEYHGEASPEGKCALIRALQADGAIVAMVGDGINDAPSLAQADVSLALGSAAALTQWTADVVVLGNDLGRVTIAIETARRTFRVIRQNLAWAFGYNAIAIPLAATGHVSPLVASLGMSISSLIVVANALRLARSEDPTEPRQECGVSLKPST